MLQFIVLGLVPGTHLQITYFWFLGLGIILDVVFGIYYSYNTFWHRSRNTSDAEVSVQELATTN